MDTVNATSKQDIILETTTYIKERFSAFHGTEVNGETDLLENGEIDSLGMLDLMTFLEERFQIEMTDDDFLPDNFETLNALADLVASKAK